MIRSRLAISFLQALFFLSGGAGLGYQMVWSRMFAAGLGHEMPSVLAVVGAFLGGMAVGSWALDGVLARSGRPGCWYGGLEILIGLWGLASTALIPIANQSALRFIGLDPSPLRQWGIAFSLPFLALLPATAAIGATFPAMERFLAPLTVNGRCVGALYAANTLGAVMGILMSTFVIAPGIGLRHSVWLLAGTNVLCGLIALLVGARLSPAEAGETAIEPGKVGGLSRRRLGITVFCAGLFGIGFETIIVRVLSQVFENTVYTFAAVLAVFLSGTSIGAALFQRFGSRQAPEGLLTDLLGAVALACTLAVAVASRAQSVYDHCRAALGDSAFAVLAAEMTVAAAVLLVPTTFMGATFSHLVQAAARRMGQPACQPEAGVLHTKTAARDLSSSNAPLPGLAEHCRGVGVGHAAAFNTLGGAVASALFGVVLLPLLGSKWTLVLISLGYLLLLPTMAGWRWGYCASTVALILALPADLHILRIAGGDRVLEFREGLMGAVAVVEDAHGDRVLRVDNRFQMGGTAAAAAEYRHAHIPLLLHPAPRRALFLGLGTGISFGAAALHPSLRSDGVELVPEIVQVMPRFEPHNFSPGRHAQLKVFVADARRFVREAEGRYDVIVADLFHPARDGAGSLYTLEHFQAVRGRLERGGLFCQWLPLHQLDEETLRVIIRTFLEVFPDARAWLLRFNVDAPVLGLVGSLQPFRYSTNWVEQRLSDPDLERELKKLALADSIRLFGNFLADPKTLREFAGQAHLNSDDQPRVTFGAPRFIYQKEATSYGRLLTLLKLGVPDPRQTLGLDAIPGADPFALRLTRYLNARDVYLKGLVEESEGRETKAIDLFVESARLSDDFTTGYAQCLSVASAWARTNPAQARALLERLIEAQPSRRVARDMLERLFGK